MADDPCPLAQVSYDEYLQIYQADDQALARAPSKRNPCKVCGDTGYLIGRDDRGYTVVKACRRTQMEQRIKLFNAAHIPGRYHAATLASFIPGDNIGLRTARTYAFQYIHSFQPGEPGILYYGGCGTGKTHLMVAMLRYLVIHRGIAVRFVEFRHLLSDLRKTFGGKGSEAQLMRPLVEVPVLAIDELGKGKMGEWALDVLDELITRRYNSKRTTMFTTNLYPAPSDPQEKSLREYVGPRIHSRLKEMCIPQGLLGSDYREIISPT